MNWDFAVEKGSRGPAPDRTHRTTQGKRCARLVALGLTGLYVRDERRGLSNPDSKGIGSFLEQEVPCPLPGRWSEQRCAELLEALEIPSDYGGESCSEWLVGKVRTLRGKGDIRGTGARRTATWEKGRNARILNIQSTSVRRGFVETGPILR